jgi:uncharacterized protein HemY
MKILHAHDEYRHEQANTYGQLGLLAEAQEQWSQAKEYFFTALRLFVEFADEHYIGATLGNLFRLYQQTHDETLLVEIGEVTGWKVEEVRAQLERLNQDSQNE